ncbi:MAG: hypothetical protein U0234_21835 [Sandaracinus sp.]
MSFRALALALVLVGAVPSLASADLRVLEANAPVDPAATPPEPEESTTTTTTTNPDGTTSTTTTTTTATTTTTPAPTSTERRPFLDDHRWLDLTGFVQPGYIQRLDNPAEGVNAGIVDDTFWVQRARIGIRAQLFSWLRARLELEMLQTPALQDAFVDIAPADWLQFRVGQFIVPFLQAYRYNELNLAFLDRPLFVPVSPDRTFIRYLAPRDVGFQIFGRIGDLSPSSMLPVFEYQLGMFNGRGPNIALNNDNVFLYSARFTLYALGMPVGADRENDLARNHIPRANVAFAAYSNCDDRQNWNRGFTVDLDFRWEGLFVEGAFVWFRNGASGTPNPVTLATPTSTATQQGQHGAFFLADSNGCQGVPDGTTTPTGQPMQVTVNTLDFVSRGASLQLQYVLPRFLTDLPFSLMDFELLFRADWVDANSPYSASDPLFGGGPGSPGYLPPPSYSDADNPPTRWRLTFGINWFPTGQNQVRLGINYQLNRESEDAVIAGQTFRGVSNDIFWLQITTGI